MVLTRISWKSFKMPPLTLESSAPTRLVQVFARMSAVASRPFPTSWKSLRDLLADGAIKAGVGYRRFPVEEMFVLLLQACEAVTLQAILWT